MIKTPVPENVTTAAGMVGYIRSFTHPVLSAKQVEDACEVIAATRLPSSWSTHRRHVDGLRLRRARAAGTGRGDDQGAAGR